jgi:hypothetical protein
VAEYRFKSCNEDMSITPEKKALEVAFKGSAYDVSVYIMGLDKRDDKSKNNFCKSIPIFELTDLIESMKLTDNKSYYICPNPLKFGKQHRTEDTIFSLKNIVMDIDAHDYNGDFNEIKPIFINTLKDEFKESGLPLWNIQVFTGRGFQLWWCLEETSKDLLWLYKMVQEGIMNKIQEVLNAYRITFDEALTLDKASSRKVAGLFRLFGTYNQIAKTKTEVEVLSEKYFSLNFLKEFFCMKKEKTEKKKITNEAIQKKSKGGYTYNKSINEYRVEMVEKLVNMRSDCTGSREMIAYVYYNESVQVYDRGIARDKLQELNSSFPIPLKDREIRALVRGIDKAVNQKNQTNCYILKNFRIIEMLDMDETEQSALQFYSGVSGTPDKNRARDTKRKQKKETRDKIIIALADQGVKQNEIAKQAGCCKRTVKEVLKVSNTYKKCQAIKECAKEAISITKEEFMNFKREINKKFMKVITRKVTKNSHHGNHLFLNTKVEKMEDKILYYAEGLGRSVGMGIGLTCRINTLIYGSPG